MVLGAILKNRVHFQLAYITGIVISITLCIYHYYKKKSDGGECGGNYIPLQSRLSTILLTGSSVV